MDDAMQDAFREAIEECSDRIIARDAESFAAIYLVGSVVRGEAVPGLSDVNLLGILRGEESSIRVSPEWIEELTAALEERSPTLRLREPDDPETGPGSFPLLTFGSLMRVALHRPVVSVEGEDPFSRERPRDDLLELQWGGRLLWGEEVRDGMSPCPVPRLANARDWAASASRAVTQAAEDMAHPRRAGHTLAKAALRCCLAVSVAEGGGFTLDSGLIAARFGERHPDWAAWATEFARARLDPPTMPERLAGLLEAARILVDWSETILHAIGRAHPLRC
jgi:hypothetical protein